MNARPTSTGKELDEETGYGYFGARYMDHELMAGWLSVDPMSDKYPNISPYAYCAWNPVKLVDPDGMEIWIITDPYNSNAPRVKWTNSGLFNEDGSAYSGDSEFAKQTASALDAIYSDKDSRFLLDNFMGDSKYDIEVSEGFDTEFHESQGGRNGDLSLQSTQSISFNPRLGLAQCKPDAEDEECSAPFICLLHEFGHAFDAVTDNKSTHERRSTPDRQYGNLEEKYVIENYENPAAARHGMLQRTSHEQNFLGLRKIQTSGPLSSIPLK
ncbi:MAG: hypothetical protein KBT45_06530 [Bacteroidales bacterium]|nr:hypothetical protein [Candidatus Colimorpha pelethequi]